MKDAEFAELERKMEARTKRDLRSIVVATVLLLCSVFGAIGIVLDMGATITELRAELDEMEPQRAACRSAGDVIAECADVLITCEKERAKYRSGLVVLCGPDAGLGD